MNKKKSFSHDIVLGFFVAIGIVLIFLAVFLIGKEKRIFDSRILVKSHFGNVAGLSVGANVMLGGVVVGHVSSISFPSFNEGSLETKDITVKMEISKSAMEWIREDSTASIGSKGLLGDKIVDITVGTSSFAKLQQGGTIKPSPSVDLNKALEKAQEILTNLGETAADAKNLFKVFVSKGGDESMLASAKSLQEILEGIKKGNGIVGALLYDKKSGEHAKEFIANLNHLTNEANFITKEIKSGNGMLGSILYDKDGKNTITKLNQNLDSLSQIFHEIKYGKGIAHDLFYADNKGNFLKELDTASLNLKKITNSVLDGEGTVGLLLQDPSIYNQLVSLLNDLNRNSIFKAVVRFGISNSDKTIKND